MSKRAIVVGAGHNGLVAAFYLARSGAAVDVYEAQSTIGGACKSEELFPGYNFSTCASWLGWWLPKIVEDMRLLERGITVGGADTRSRIFEHGQSFVWWQDEDRLISEIGRYSRRDATSWSDWEGMWDASVDLLGPWLLSRPPSLRELLAHADSLGKAELLSVLLTTSIAELSDQFFESPEMRACVETTHDVGSMHDHGSALVRALALAMRKYSPSGWLPPSGYVRGGMGEVTRAMRDAAVEHGANIYVNSPVEEIVVSGGRAVGVRLASGELCEADAVLSGTDPVRTFLRLVGADKLAPTFRRKLEALRTDIAPMKLHCALSGLPEWTAFEGTEIPFQGLMSINPSRAYYERAWDDARHARLPEAPILTAMTPSYWDDTLAPPGDHTMSFWSLFAPPRLQEGTWSARRGEMTERMLGVIERHAPDFRRHLLDVQLLTPQDLEERVLLTDGNIHHVDISPSQMLWQRPLSELAQYSSPIAGLYLCGAGQHPYGEVSGGPGHNAAHVVLEEWGAIPPGTWQEIFRFRRERAG